MSTRRAFLLVLALWLLAASVIFTGPLVYADAGEVALKRDFEPSIQPDAGSITID